MMVRIEAFLRRLWRRFSLAEWMIHLLNLSKVKDAEAAPGLVMIQIDGLGFTQAMRAIQKGRMPFLARLLQKENYTPRRLYTGLPASTPAVQGRIFYGVKACVPGFNFKDHRTQQVFNMFNPASASAVEDRIKGQGEPLLKGGSAYGNIFTGGADEVHFCASSIGWGGFLNAASPWGLPLTILLNLHIFIRALFLILVELFLAVFDFFRGVILGKNFLTELSFIPLRVAVCALLREVITAGARIDIARGLPVIHLNLAGYDEQAHHRGPASRYAHWSLRGIDSAVAKVWRAAHQSSQREYTVFIYSDHGQEEAVRYRQEYGRSLEKAVEEVLNEYGAAGARWAESGLGSRHWRAEALIENSGRKTKAEIVENKEAPPRVIITSMGPVAHIYFPKTLSFEEKEKIALSLIGSAKIPIVIMPHGPNQAYAWNHQGKFILPAMADQVLERSHPFFKEVASDLVELCHHPDAGELILFGWRKGDKPLTFYDEQGSHAGPGPEETSGFSLLPRGALTLGTGNGPEAFGAGRMDAQDLRQAALYALGRTSATVVAKIGHAKPIPGDRVLRIMTYNVHGCMGRDGKISPNRIAGIIAKQGADVIALQELDVTEHMHQAQIIAKKLSMVFYYTPSFSRNGGQRGNAIFSRFPMRLVRHGSLPKLPRSPVLEVRSALWVELDFNGYKVQVFNTHLSLLPRERRLQMKYLLGPDWLGHPNCGELSILCGDFNAAARSKIFKNIGPTLKNTCFDLAGHRALKTLPSFYPLSLVDHIFVGPGLITTRIEVPKTALEKMASDHLPLLVEVQGPCISPMAHSGAALISGRRPSF